MPENKPELHTLGVPIPLSSLREILPEVEVEELTGIESHRAKKFGDPINRNFIYRAYDLLCYPGNEADRQFALGRARLKNQIIVDLGAGTNLHGFNLACAVGAMAYVAIEPFHTDDLIANFALGQQPLDRFEKVPLTGFVIPACVVRTHALAFLKKVPDKRVSVIASGLDSTVLPDPQYRLDLAREVGRVLSLDGLFLSNNSYIYPQGLTEEAVSPGIDRIYYFYHTKES